MTSPNLISCLNKLIDDNIQYSLLNNAYKNGIDVNSPHIILESLYKKKPHIFDSLDGVCLPVPNEITAFIRNTKGTSTPKSIISEKYKTSFDTAQHTTSFFSTSPSTIAAKFKIDLCNLLHNPSFCSDHPGWSAAGVLLCMIDAKHGTAFADVPSGTCAYNTGCHSSDFSNLRTDPDGSNSLAMQIAFEMCDVF